MKRKNINVKFFVIGIVILFAILMIITAHSLDDKKELNFFEKTIKDSVTFVEKVLYSPIGFVKDKIEMFSETKKLYKKYTKLKEKVEKTEVYYAQIEELQKEVAELKSTLELNSTLSEYSYVNATVVNRNVGYWYNTFTIDMFQSDIKTTMYRKMNEIADEISKSNVKAVYCMMTYTLCNIVTVTTEMTSKEHHMKM